MKHTIDCKNIDVAIKSQKSTDLLKKILRSMNIWEDDVKEIASIFNKIKNLQPINIEEEIKIEEIISNWDFTSKLRELLTNYEIDEDKLDEFSQENILITIHSYIFKSSIIDLLDKKKELEITQIKNRRFTKVVSDWWKTNYLEVIQELNWFIFCKNIKGDKKKIVDIKSWKIIFETKDDFEIENRFDINDLLFLKNTSSWEDYIITNKYAIWFDKKSIPYLWEYFLSIIDLVNRKIHKIDLKNLNHSLIDLRQYNILEWKNWNLLLLQESIPLKNWKNITYSQWILSFYNIDLSKEIINNIHLKYHKIHIPKKIFICLSYDEEKLYKYDFETEELEEFDLKKKSKFGDELWEEIQKTL